MTTDVRLKIEQIISGAQPSPGTISKFIDLFTSDIKAAATAALGDWYRKTNPGPEDLKKLFPDMELGSVRTQISRDRRTR